MKLAEALQERADLNRKVDQLRNRLSNNCTVQEGENPAEDPAALLVELDASIERRQWLFSHINKTNCQTVLQDGKTLTDVIAEKDALNMSLRTYRVLIGDASSTARRATRTEIKILPTVNVAQLQKKADDIAKRLRLLDNTLQSTNWTVDLIE